MIREGCHIGFRFVCRIVFPAISLLREIASTAFPKINLKTSGLLNFSSVLLVLFALGGCSLTGAVKGALSSGDPSKTFDLVLDRSLISRAGRLDTQLVVQVPAAVRALAGDNILVKPSPTVVTYYGGAVWGDRLPKLLQARMVEAIQATGRFRAVSDGSDRINGDVTLSSTIEAFQVDVMGERGAANVVVFAKLIHVSSGKVYASRSFNATVGAPSRDVEAGVAALNEAMNIVLRDMSRWVVKRGRLRIAS